MKKEKLIELGLSEELADKVLEIHNTALEEANGTITNLRKDLKKAQDAAREFEGIDMESVKKAEYERGKKEVSDEFEKYKYNRTIDDELAKSGAKNTKALKALLDMDKIKIKDGKLEGLSEQLETIKKDNEFLFDTNIEKPRFGGGSGGGGEDSGEVATLRAAMGLKTE